VAGLFGPHERVWGVDLGATGTAMFGLTLWTGAWLFARHPDAIFPTEWSIAERRAWAGLLFLTLVSGSFVRFMIAMAQLDVPPVSIAELPSRHFLWNLFVLLIAWAIVAKALRGPQKDVVELDGNAAFIFVVIAIVLMLAYLPAEHLTWWLSPLVAAHALIGLLIGRSFLEHVLLVAQYARDRR
jgi:hypothetical protein